jgi:predicted membrane protein
MRPMKIKPQNLLRFLLLIPYLGWGLALLSTFLISDITESLHITNSFLETLAIIVGIYAIGIILWGIPYTILTVGTLLWSRKKSAPAIYKVLLFSPLLLSLLMTVEVALVEFWPQQIFTPKWQDFLAYTSLVLVTSLTFGYVFVVVGLVIYKAIGRLNLLKTCCIKIKCYFDSIVASRKNVTEKVSKGWQFSGQCLVGVRRD